MAFARTARWLGTALGVVSADQLTKQLVERLTEEHWSRTILPGFFDLVHRHNPGIAFGLFADAQSRWATPLLVVFAGAAIALLVWLLARGHAGGALGQAGLALILGGALGNLLDRLQHGSVIDFIDLYVGANHWPAFNVADSAITVGAGLVILELLRSPRERKA
jgi:signal peptidase II